MKDVPKSLRLQIGIFGRMNVGKSSFLNMIASQDVSIVSNQPGTTTDVVEKAMELRPVGPVVFLDTAGVDDISSLSSARLGRTAAAFKRADVFVVVTEEGHWGEYEKGLAEEAQSRGVPLIVVVNKTDREALSAGFRERLLAITPHVMPCSCVQASFDKRRGGGRPLAVDKEPIKTAFRDIMAKCAPNRAAPPQAILSDLLPHGGLAVLIVPIDDGAPKGRLMLPQAQAIRDVIGANGVAMVVRDSEYATALATLNKRPDIVVCDSQVVGQIAAQTPPDIQLTTFSILFARFKGFYNEALEGVAAIGKLKNGDRVLIAEACTHHAIDDDIGRVKIPRWLKEHTGLDLQTDVFSGRDYPQNIERYSLIIQCGACMLSRQEMVTRVKEAAGKHVPMTNYGMAIAHFQGALKRVIEPFENLY